MEMIHSRTPHYHHAFDPIVVAPTPLLSPCSGREGEEKDRSEHGPRSSVSNIVLCL